MLAGPEALEPGHLGGARDLAGNLWIGARAVIDSEQR
jgi:hypothetical protein